MAIHRLKITPEHFQAVFGGDKNAEIRLNDRNYQVGDSLILKEWDGSDFTNRVVSVRVTHILDDEKYLQKGYVMLSFKEVLM